MSDNTSTPPTQWQQLRVSAPSRQIDDLADFLTAAGALAITYVDRADDPILEPDPGTTPLWQQTSVVALFADTTELEPIVQAMHTRLGASLFCEREILVDQDWERACLRDFKPMRFGSNFWICPSWDVVKDPFADSTRLRVFCSTCSRNVSFICLPALLIAIWSELSCHGYFPRLSRKPR